MDVAVGGDMGGDGVGLASPSTCLIPSAALRGRFASSDVEAVSKHQLTFRCLTFRPPSIARIGLRARQNRWQIGARAETSL